MVCAPGATYRPADARNAAILDRESRSNDAAAVYEFPVRQNEIAAEAGLRRAGLQCVNGRRENAAAR